MQNNGFMSRWRARLQARWRRFASERPGERFEQHYRRARQRGHSRWHAAALVVAGVALVLLGLVMLVAPGPGLLAIVAGGALLAQQSLKLARGMDKAEVGLRRVWGRFSH